MSPLCESTSPSLRSLFLFTVTPPPAVFLSPSGPILCDSCFSCFRCAEVLTRGLLPDLPSCGPFGTQRWETLRIPENCDRGDPTANEG